MSIPSNEAIGFEMEKPMIPHALRRLMELANGYRGVCVLGALAELGAFDVLSTYSYPDGMIAAPDGTTDSTASCVTTTSCGMTTFHPFDALSAVIPSQRRALRILLDAATALEILEKRDDAYAIRVEYREYLDPNAPRSYLPMLCHTMSCLRNWTQLARTARDGVPASQMESFPRASIRGAESDRAAFIAAMHSVSGPLAGGLVTHLSHVLANMQPPFTIQTVLDVGGASGTWTLEFLKANPQSRAILFDLPDAIRQAKARLASTPFAERITLVEGDFYRDPLPTDANFAWVSAIVHQHGREENRKLYGKIRSSLSQGGMIAIRDMVMRESRTTPVEGALFAVNMLAATQTGDTFTLDEFREDLESVGFTQVQLTVDRPDMFAVVTAQTFC